MLNHLRGAKCRSCGAPIVWAINGRTGNCMPVNAKPSPDGNLRIRDDRSECGQVVVDVVSGAEREALRVRGEAFLSHFSTCPQASRWRTPRWGGSATGAGGRPSPARPTGVER